ncbi:metal-sulfur cluster assembly factor [Planctomicrobium sp. SH664]|uniref:metal-sulfur cluster assembly factor n=1 Tax=Planctomicrobium sp. SH664 TaxID=3448125 RepID=UPI003F5BC364
MANETELLDALRQVIDPELMVNIVDLGLVYEVTAEEEGNVKVSMTLTSPSCPAGPQIIQQAKMALEQLPDVSAAEIKLVMSPPWTPERMTEEARDQLGIF